MPDATAVVLLAGALLTIAVGLLRRRRPFLAWLPGATFLALGAALFYPWPAPLRSWSSAALVAAGLALIAHLVTAAPDRDPRSSGGSSRVALGYLAAAVVLAAALLLHDLGSYAGTLQRWESAVVYGFGLPFRGGVDPWSYAVQQLHWNNGILSLGAQSYFFGVPTYALFHLIGFSPWSLRIIAVVGMLLNVVAIFVLARRFFDPLVAGAAAMLLALNECALFYGRYGSSPAGTILAVLLAIGATWLFLERDRPRWWMAWACAAALYVATLQYAVARIVVLIILGFIPLVMAWEWRRFTRQRALGLAVIVVAAGAVWFAQGERSRQVFLFGQGEQFFYMTKFPEYVASFCPTCPQLLPDQTAYQMALLRRWLAGTIPEYLELTGPRVDQAWLRDWGAPVLPHVYYAPLLLFIGLGIAHSLRRWRSAPHAFLLLWASGATVPLLLASRVDSHRMMLFVIPASLWGALGAWEAARIMTRASVPRSVQHLLAVALLVTLFAYDLRRVWGPSPAPAAAARVLAEEIERIPGPVTVGALIDPPRDTMRDFEFVDLGMLERQRQDPRRTTTVVPYQLLTALHDAGAAPKESDVDELVRVAGPTTLVLAPGDGFRAVAAALERRGARIAEVGTSELHVLKLDGNVAAANARDGGSPTP